MLDRRYRLSPSFAVIELADLTPDDRAIVASIRLEPSLTSVLLPRERGLSAKAVTADAASLLASLRAPGTLPAAARVAFARDEPSLQRLVLDGILEVECEGAFVTGSRALATLAVDVPDPRPRRRPAVLALEALRYAQALEGADGSQLAARLYGYNCAPASPRWRRLLGTEAEVRTYLGLERGGDARRLLERDWVAGIAPSNPGWLFWRLRSAPQTSLCHKLYISPRCEHLAAALQVVVPILTELEIPSFKVGRDLYGVLRPDKLVVYAPSLRALRRAQTALRPALAGLDAQGVPFTAPIDGAGLLSWGLDPPEHESLSPSRGTSWRRWLTERLAVAILVAKRGPSALSAPEPWRFALARVGLDGVDTTTWLPTAAAWTPP